MALPNTIALVCEQWSLTLGSPFIPGGETAWLAPATDASGRELVLKVGWRHLEAEDEARGLRFWAGDGAVKVFADETFDESSALALERCRPGTPLHTRPEPEQDEVVANLLARLWRDPGPGSRFRPLQQMCDAWADEVEASDRHTSLDPGLLRAGIALLRELPSTARRSMLLCTDLHAGNVLAATRERWLMIDPKPYVGDPAFDVLQHLLNCEARLLSDPCELASRMAALTGLEQDRVVLWLFARCVQESLNWPELATVASQIAPP